MIDAREALSCPLLVLCGRAVGLLAGERFGPTGALVVGSLVTGGMQ